MGLLGKLVLKMSADSADFESNMKKARKSAKKFGQQTKQAAGVAAKATAAAGVAALAAGTMIVRANLASIDSLAKTADKLGITTDALAGMRHAAELTGVGQEKLDKSLQKMIRSIGEAKTGIGTAKDYLDQMGLSAGALSAMKPEEQFAAISEEINGLATQSDKAAAAAAIFGREGVALLNTMKLGADGLAATSAEAATLGLALSRVDAAKVEAANDAMTRMSAAVAGFGKTLTVAVAPFIDDIATRLTEAGKKADGFRLEVQWAMEQTANGAILAGRAFVGFGIAVNSVYVEFLDLQATIWGTLRASRELNLSVRGVLPGVLGGEGSEGYAAAQKLLVEQKLILAQIAIDKKAALKTGADQLNQYEELEGKVRAYAAAVQKASQDAAEGVAAGAVGGGGAGAEAARKAEELAAVARKAEEVAAAAAAARKAEELAATHALYDGKLSALNNYLTDEQGRLFNAAVNRADMVISANEAGMINEVSKNELLEQIAADHDAKLTEIEKKGSEERNRWADMSRKEQISSTADSAITLLSVAGKYNKKAEKVARTAAAVRATIAMWQGVAEGVKLGWPQGIPAVAWALATGAMALSNIGGAGGSPSTATTANGETAMVTTTDPLASQAPQQQTVTVNIQGNVIGNQDYIDNDLIPGINDALNREYTLDLKTA